MLRTVLLGWEATCEINGDEFGIRAGSISWDIDDEECGDSLFAQVKAHKPGRYDCDVSLEFYEKSDVAVATADTGLQQRVLGNGPVTATNAGAGGYLYGDDSTILTAAEITLVIRPNGNTANNKSPWVFPSLVLRNYRISWDMDGKQQGTLAGKSNGTFVPPSN